MHPHGALARADGRNERAAIRGEIDAVLFGHPEGDLFRRTVGKTLAPDVRSVALVRREIHPLPIGRPRGLGTLRRRRTDCPSGRAAVERDKSAWKPRTLHFGCEYPFPIG